MISHVTNSRVRPGQSHAEFELTTTWGSADIDPTVVWRRFREFDALAKQLSYLALPSLPPKRIWGSASPDVVAQRPGELDEWVSRVTRMDKSKALLNFLGMFDAEVPKAAKAQSDKPKVADKPTQEDAKKRALKNFVSAFVQKLVPQSDEGVRCIRLLGDEEEDAEAVAEIRAKLDGVTGKVFVIFE